MKNNLKIIVTLLFALLFVACDKKAETDATGATSGAEQLTLLQKKWQLEDVKLDLNNDSLPDEQRKFAEGMVRKMIDAYLQNKDQFTFEFKADGKVEQNTPSMMEGGKPTNRTDAYTLEGNTLKMGAQTQTVEALTADKLVLTTISKDSTKSTMIFVPAK